MFFFSIRFFYILTHCQRNQNISRILEGHSSIKSWFRRTQKNPSSGLAEKESDWLNLANNKKAAPKVVKVVSEKLHWGMNIQRTYNINKLWDSLRVEFVDRDMTRPCKDLETLSSFAIFSRVSII